MAAPLDSTTHQLRLLGDLVKQRRIALGYKSKELGAEACGLSHVPYRDVEGGRRTVSAATYAKIENGFKFRAGSCQAVLDGADSITLTDGTELIHGGQISRPSLEEATTSVRASVDSAARLTVPDLTHRQTEAFTEQLVEELKKRGILPSAP
ncbi:helix-turn-helix transcriptional regulator [Streptomyces sp. 4R-3d]|uniref:helix-turn-helix domain-containing protein n=1 Tax=Streptomyces sp. 4R-3d TaxID=2559605 RepID=UPI001071F88B|nr:helix-turn-helix transcriptional regulator [Streptomyces sp. 4R-3d]TFI30084.1 XRE family transcriptional regulator [Streptomyces sp. 4R-3d]